MGQNLRTRTTDEEVSNVLGIYHDGELAVQARAGVQDLAERAEGVIKTTMKPVVQEFLH